MDIDEEENHFCAKEEALMIEKEELQLISIRLSKVLISDLKVLAAASGAKYQQMIREILTRHAETEIRRIAHEYANKIAKKKDNKP